MSTPRDVSASDARDQRRWLITIGITVVFGMFGAVMALLAYTKITGPAPRRPGAAVTRPATPSTAAPTPSTIPVPAAVPTPAPEPAPKDKPNHGKDHKPD